MARVLEAAVVALALTLVTAGCGGGSPSSASTAGEDSELIDVAPSFAAGTTYSVTIETGTRVATPTAKTSATVTIESNRRIESGGTYKRAPISWMAAVERIRISGETDWDSKGSEPPPAELAALAALVGASYRVEIDPRGAVFVRDLELTMSELPKEQRKAMRAQLGEGDKLSQSLANSVFRTLSDLPSRRARVGDSWTVKSDVPTLSPDAVRETRWKLNRIEDGEAHFTLQGRYRSGTLEGGEDEGRAVYDLASGTFTRLDIETKLFLQGGSRTVTTTRMRVVPAN